jgi:hypothetical protein
MRSTALRAVIIVALTARAARAQLSTDTLSIRSDRSATTATVFGAIVPGAGHLYAGEYLRGIGFYFMTVSAIGSGAMTYILDRCTFDFSGTCNPGPSWPHRALGIAEVAAGVSAWTISALDAHRAVDRRLTRRRSRILRRVGITELRPLFAPPGSISGAFEVGVHGTW